ncbi:hypothetical protein, partial [Serratia ureilytica]|uniref:hypothetical protein n=1 Tax=Serratia ureilytica TaxID=300181 RepID=UPI00313E376C
KYRADAAVVGMLGIPVQLRHILLLFPGIARKQLSGISALAEAVDIYFSIFISSFISSEASSL